MAQRDHARGPAEFQRLEEHVGQRGKVAFAEAGDGPEIRGLLGGEPAERDDVRARLFQFPRGPHTHAVSVEHDPQHQPRIIRRLAFGLGIGSVEPGQIQFIVHKLANEPGQMALGQPFLQRRRDQHHRIGHERLEAFPGPAVGIHRHIGRGLDPLHERLVEQTIQARRTGIHAPDSPSHQGQGLVNPPAF